METIILSQNCAFNVSEFSWNDPRAITLVFFVTILSAAVILLGAIIIKIYYGMSKSLCSYQTFRVETKTKAINALTAVFVQFCEAL